MSEAESQPAASPPKRRWYRVTPDRLVLVLLAVECLLWLSNRLGCPTWHKGYAVLTGVALVGAAMLFMLLWFVAAVLFRLRFQFSIRFLLVLTAAVAVACSWMTVEMKKAERQREAVAAIVKRGVPVWYVVYDFFQLDADGGTWDVTVREPPEPAWLRACIGVDLCSDVLAVIDIHRDGLRYLPEFPHLRQLFINDRMEDADLARLHGLKELKKLVIYQIDVSQEAMQELGEALPKCDIQWNCGEPN